jgi:hypothetical protein
MSALLVSMQIQLFFEKALELSHHEARELSRTQTQQTGISNMQRITAEQQHLIHKQSMHVQRA